MKKIVCCLAGALAFACLAEYKELVVQEKPFPLTVREYVYPAANFPITDYGAKPDGSKCTEAFAKAMAACNAAGGGHVVVPAGKWTTGAIRFKSNCDLHLSEGAEVVFTQNPEDYLPAVFTSWEGMECWNYCPLIYALECENVAITGPGMIRGFEGEWKQSFWYPWVPQDNGIRAARRQLYDWGATDYPVEKRQIWKKEKANTRPHFVQFNRCRNVKMEGFKLRQSPFWTLHVYHSQNVVVRGLDVYAHGNNNDGIDIEMSKDVLVEKCRFDQGDDSFVIKSGRNRVAFSVAAPTENVVFRDCHLEDAHTLLGVGSEISGGVKNIYVHDCSVQHANRLCYIKTNQRRGGVVENIWFERIKAESSTEVFSIGMDVLYEWAKFPDYEIKLTEIKNVYVKDVTCGTSKQAIILVGDPRLPPKGLHLENVAVGKVTKSFSRIENVEDVTFDNVKLK
ncbi:MAG: glycoside hydrolase family 28 protein [Kiritimatiellae bacterium]|nr:glycoside hydrolase family 28 protein [Kiritimatiellia bacterium]